MATNVSHGVMGWLESFWLPGWTPAHIPDMRGKVALVTGGNSGMGFETSRKLAENGAKVLLVSRDIKNGEEAANKIRSEVGKSAQVEVLGCDMISLRNVIDLANQVKRMTNKLDLLINVAGVFYPGPMSKSAEGIEQTLAINYYANALLTLCLLDLLRSTPNSRCVFMGSAVENVGVINWHDMKGETYLTSGLIPYGTSKLQLAMFGRELARRVPDVDFFVVHPGLVDTPLHDKSDPRYPLNFVFKVFTPFFGQNPLRGAYSTLYAATEPSLTGQHFAFYAPRLFPLNLWPTEERPFYRSGRVSNDHMTEKLFEKTQDVFQEILGASTPARLPNKHVA